MIGNLLNGPSTQDDRACTGAQALQRPAERVRIQLVWRGRTDDHKHDDAGAKVETGRALEALPAVRVLVRAQLGRKVDGARGEVEDPPRRVKIHRRKLMQTHWTARPLHRSG